MAFWKFKFNFEYFLKKRWLSKLMYFLTYGLGKAWLDKCQTSPISEDPSTSNMVKGQKNFWNLNNSSFTIFCGPCAANSGWKNLSKWYAKSWDSLLTQCWLPMTSIFFITETIHCNRFRCNYLGNENLFPNAFWIFLIYIQFWTFLNKGDPDGLCIFELTESEQRG